MTGDDIKLLEELRERCPSAYPLLRRSVLTVMAEHAIRFYVVRCEANVAISVKGRVMSTWLVSLQVEGMEFYRLKRALPFRIDARKRIVGTVPFAVGVGHDDFLKTVMEYRKRVQLPAGPFYFAYVAGTKRVYIERGNWEGKNALGRWL